MCAVFEPQEQEEGRLQSDSKLSVGEETTTTLRTTTTAKPTTTTTTTTTTVTTAAPAAPLLRGDCNCSNMVDVSDAVLLARFLAEDRAAKLSEQGRKNADCNADGDLTGEDVISILRKIAKLE